MTAAASQNRVSDGRSGPARPKAGFWALTLGSIGVVYGDIGTSPLYALRESVVAAVGPGNPANEVVVLGIRAGDHEKNGAEWAFNQELSKPSFRAMERR